ncbi:excisionase [Draconibacterium mangrovi]|uniref:excisionase n=1 Tax=Draconibacterium mangrovi TaxID=2697469 RepID=UPI0013D6BE6E|nr:excisionase [Draconibacterium mangrovi]
MRKVITYHCDHCNGFLSSESEMKIHEKECEAHRIVHDWLDIKEIEKKTWLNENEAAVYTGFGIGMLDKLRFKGTQLGTLPYVLISGKYVRFRRVEIDKYLMKHSCTPQSGAKIKS